MVSETLTDENKHLDNTLLKDFDTFQLSNIPFTLPDTIDDRGQDSGLDGGPPPGGYRLYKSRFAGLVALVSFESLLCVWFHWKLIVEGHSWYCRWLIGSMVRPHC